MVTALNAQKSRGRTAGFTLLEVLVVMAILGILMAVMVTLPRDPYAVRSAATMLSNSFSRARMEALRQNEYVGVRVDPTSKSFFLFVDKDRSLSYNTGDTAVPNTTMQLGSGDFPGVRFGSTFTGLTFIFDTRGIPRTLTAATIPVTNAGEKYTRTVVVSRMGRTSIQ